MSHTPPITDEFATSIIMAVFAHERPMLRADTRLKLLPQSLWRPSRRWVSWLAAGVLNAAIVLSALQAAEAQAAPLKAAGNADADLRPIVIHGAFVFVPELWKKVTPSGQNPDPETDAEHAIDANACVSCLLGNNDGGPGLTPSPPPTASWPANQGLGTQDPGLAVGRDSVMVSSRNVIALYDKTGQLIGKKATAPFPNPFSVDDIFVNTVEGDINANLQLPSGLPPNVTAAGFGVSKASTNGTSYYDTRVAFDPYRNRYVIVALAINNNMVDLINGRNCAQYPAVTCGAVGVSAYPALKFARRDFVITAVSRTADPRDGFLVYWWNASIDQGQCFSEVGCPKTGYARAYTSADFPTIAITERDLTISIGSTSRDGSISTASLLDADTWVRCPSNSCGMERYAHLQSIPLQKLANGYGQISVDGSVGSCTRSAAGCPGGWQYGLPIDNHHNAWSTKVIRPATSAGTTVLKQALFASAAPFDSMNVKDVLCNCAHLDVWTLDTSAAVPALNVKGSPIRGFGTSDNIGWFVTNAMARNNQLVAGFTELLGSRTGVRVVLVNLQPGQLANATAIDRTLANGNVNEDGAGGVNYSWPSVGLNASGDVVAGYLRQAVGLPTELRYSVKRAKEVDFHPSARLHGGEVALPGQATGRDTVGAAIDPSNDGGFWFANLYADLTAPVLTHKQRLWVGKVLGRPPVAAMARQIAPSFSTGRSPLSIEDERVEPK